VRAHMLPLSPALSKAAAGHCSRKLHLQQYNGKYPTSGE